MSEKNKITEPFREKIIKEYMRLGVNIASHKFIAHINTRTHKLDGYVCKYCNKKVKTVSNKMINEVCEIKWDILMNSSINKVINEIVREAKNELTRRNTPRPLIEPREYIYEIALAYALQLKPEKKRKKNK